MKLFNLKNLFVCLAVTAAAGLSSCDSVVYDDEQDCTIDVKFRYDMNLKYADAFAHEVHSVHLFVLDKAGNLIYEKSEKGDALAQEGYHINIDLDEGEYRFLAWCGMDNDTDKESFKFHDATEGELLRSVRLQHGEESGMAVSKDDLYGLYHGAIDVEIPHNRSARMSVTIPLTKDTNHLRVIMQHLRGEDTDVNDFAFRVVEDNGHLRADNMPVEYRPIEYRPWGLTNGVAGVDNNKSRTVEDVQCAIADLTFSRLMADSDQILEITTENGTKTVARIPLIDYFLMVQSNFLKTMPEQEFLDRQDEYSLTIFLDSDDKWVSTYINILSWRVVVNNTDIDY